MFTATLFIKPKSGNNSNVHQLKNEQTKCGMPTQWNRIKP